MCTESNHALTDESMDLVKSVSISVASVVTAFATKRRPKRELVDVAFSGKLYRLRVCSMVVSGLTPQKTVW